MIFSICEIDLANVELTEGGQCGQTVFGEAQEESTQLTTEGERKHVTVLFSDLSGYTALSEKLDPEEVKEITRQNF